MFYIQVNLKMNYYNKKGMEGSIGDGFVRSIFDSTETLLYLKEKFTRYHVIKCFDYRKCPFRTKLQVLSGIRRKITSRTT